MSKSEVIQAGKYRFLIKRNIQMYRDQILIHTYKIGGDYEDCINISYIYENNKPLQAKIPHLLYEPECAVGSFLEKGSGTELIIKAALLYAYNDVNTIPFFQFDDNSHIDCVEKNMAKSPPRKSIKPVNLAFFYIAYHGKTWYEARFNAKMINLEKYRKYKNSLKFLTDPSQKPAFTEFLKIIRGSLETTDNLDILEGYYNRASTYREFFENIPKTKRCDILYEWLTTFMKYYIGSTFSDKEWYIDVNNMNNLNEVQSGGSLSRSVKYRIFSYKKMSNF